MKAAIAAFAILIASGASAADIKVIGSPGVREVYNEIVPGFEKATGHKVTTEWGGVNEIAKRVADGETADIVLLPAAQIDELIAKQKLLSATRVVLAKSGVGFAIRAGAPKIDATSSDAIKRALLAANKISYSTGPSGVHMEDVIRKWGIEGAVKSKIVIPPTNTPVGVLISQGGADIGFQQVSELIHVPGIQYLGPLPPDIQEMTIFAAALEPSAMAADAARALVKYLSSPEAAAALRRAGMEPG